MCVPSRWEGFGLVFMEAAACGAPIVSSNIAPMNEYFTHNESAHLISDIANPSVLAAGIRQVCENAHYRERLTEHALNIAGRFSVQEVHKTEAAVYQKALAGPPLCMKERLRIALWKTKHKAVRQFRKTLSAPY